MVTLDTLHNTAIDKLKTKFSDTEILDIVIKPTSGKLSVKGLLRTDTEETSEIGEYEEKELFITDEELVQFAEDKVDSFTSQYSASSSVTQESEPVFRLRKNKQSLTTKFTLDIGMAEKDVSELQAALVDVNTGIPSEESLHTMSVHLTEHDDTLNYDFTIHYTTDTPHANWLNCDTLEDYFKMVARNNDDMTVQDMREKDTYYAHTHCMGENKASMWLKEYITACLESHMTIESDDITVSPYKFDITDFSRGEAELTFHINQCI